MAGMQECENCHAPLPLGAPGAIVECSYCRVQNRVAGATGVMPAAGLGGPPPGHPQPPRHGYGHPHHAHEPLAVPVRHPSSPAAMVIVIVTLGFLVTCGMGMAVWLLVAAR